MGPDDHRSEIDATLRSAPLEALRGALGDAAAFLVGGTVRDLLLGLPAGRDLDVAVEGELEPVLERLGGVVRRHDRFATASAELDGVRVDLARTRRERYPAPGALPTVEPAGIDEDLARRDFTVNAIALGLADGELLDPHDGVADLGRGLLRILHPDSFSEDPTRALRAARYATRFGFELEEETLAAVGEADLSSVSSDRIEAELRLIAAEADPIAPFELLDRWGIFASDPGGRELGRTLAALVTEPRWVGVVPRAEAVLAAIRDDPRIAAGRKLAHALPDRPSHGVELAAGHDGVALAVARVEGAEWLDTYLDSWRHVRLAIDGTDLLEAGVGEGPAVGRGLATALRARLDGEIPAGREAELEVALRAAAEPG